ncbi:hypothetical protein Ais01nite_04390 [Asanoa ishikariensis]|uniref:PknH-like extracellular domain-containing protein n=1 Tax=Asanoa ishikariensis TaxID=137265 RepID=A0A1H3THK8_9ACTN|nr:hypothetical protein [Asanoa ishikariensis]GIF62404.1 hypothetical protein Ais01nite_04390 [Asanoa ishikariensis]SDZ49802.1 hypothetical protein SAMN05421684_5792 [Asanoa ishikariensis]
MRTRPATVFGLALIIAVLAGCGGPAEPTTYTLPSDEELGVQPHKSFDPEAEVRVRKAMFGPGAPVAGLVPYENASGATDDVVSGLCNNRRGNGVYGSEQGQSLLWRSADLTIESFAGVFAAPSAATAVEQVKGKFTCTEYTDDVNPDARMAIPAQDADGWHRDIRRLDPPPLKGVENAVFFCESVKKVNQRCYAALAREDVVSRLTVTALTTERAEQVTRSLLDEAAARLVAATQ